MAFWLFNCKLKQYRLFDRLGEVKGQWGDTTRELMSFPSGNGNE